MSFFLSVIVLGVILSIMLADVYLNHSDFGTYVLRKLTSDKFPSSNPTVLQKALAGATGLGVIIVGFLIVYGIVTLGSKNMESFS